MIKEKLQWFVRGVVIGLAGVGARTIYSNFKYENWFRR